MNVAVEHGRAEWRDIGLGLLIVLGVVIAAACSGSTDSSTGRASLREYLSDLNAIMMVDALNRATLTSDAAVAEDAAGTDVDLLNVRRGTVSVIVQQLSYLLDELRLLEPSSEVEEIHQHQIATWAELRDLFSDHAASIASVSTLAEFNTLTTAFFDDPDRRSADARITEGWCLLRDIGSDNGIRILTSLSDCA